MAKDIVPELLAAIQESFNVAFAKDPTIIRISGLIANGTATHAQSALYAIKTGNILSDAFKTNLSSSILPDGKMYYNIAERILTPTLGNNYEIITQASMEVQLAMNRAAGLGIKAIKPKQNIDRVQGLVDLLSEADHFDDVAFALDKPVVNYSLNIVDELIKANADFHYQAGLSPSVKRIAESGACDWCREVAGEFNYPDVPSDTWRRHDSCGCVIEYDPGDGAVRKHSGYGKRSWDVSHVVNKKR